MQREKRTKSGPLLEVDFYPVFESGKAWPTRRPKSKPTTAEMRRYNQQVATKKLIRLVNANFGAGDYFMHITYDSAKAPQTEDEARRDLVNYLRRVKTRRAAELKRERERYERMASLPPQYQAAIGSEGIKAEMKIAKLSEPMRYIYVIEKQTYKRGVRAGQVNWHFHVFLTGGLTDSELEEMWPHGRRVNCDNYQPERFGPESAALYIAKDPQGAKRFSYSRNLKKPEPKVYDDKISARGVEKIARLRVDDAAYWENRYKGYRFLRCYARYNEYNQSWYVSAVMYKTDADPPAWGADEWITSFV